MSVSLGPTAADARVWFWILSRSNVSNWNLWVCPSTLSSEMSCCKEEVNFLPAAKMVSKSYLKWWQKNTCANWLLAFHLKGAGKKNKRAALVFALQQGDDDDGECKAANVRIYDEKGKYYVHSFWGGFCSFCGDTKCINHKMERFEIVAAVMEKKEIIRWTDALKLLLS